MRIIQQASIAKGTRVFMRYELDVPTKGGTILETFRLKAGLDTLKHIIVQGGRPVIAGHRGQPHGQYDQTLSTKQLLPFFEGALGKGTFDLLENLRFDIREEENSEDFAKELASHADIYVNECFSTCHRKHASIVGVPKLLPAYAGFRLQKEVETLSKVITAPQRPFVVIIGGAKLESKIPVIAKFLTLADYVLLGGKVAQEWQGQKPANLILPEDFAPEKKDIGPLTIKKYKNLISTAKTVLWTGPLGVYEESRYILGTREIGQQIAVSTATGGAFSIIGGGDTVTALDSLKLLGKYSFVSTGGGAMLQYITAGTLPGIEVLN